VQEAVVVKKKANDGAKEEKEQLKSTRGVRKTTDATGARDQERESIS